jgi:hypothetical protein
MAYNCGVAWRAVTVAETPQFVRDAERLLSEGERHELIEYIAHFPEAGDVMPGTGGVRKLRWGLEGRGKRGGARVIYFFYNETMPIFLLSAFAKNERIDLTQAEKNRMRQLTTVLIDSYGSRRQRQQ